MAEPNVRVVARFAVKPDQVDAFIAAARKTLVEPSRRDAGCIQYDLCQDAADPTRFAMIESWESEAALEAHLGQPWLHAAVTKLVPMGTEPPSVQRLRPVS